MKQGDTVFVSATATGLGKDKKAVIDKIENVMGTTFVTVTYTHPDAVSGLGGCFVASHIIETDSREKSLIRLALEDRWDAVTGNDDIAVKGLPLFASGFVFFGINIVSIGYFQSLERDCPAMIITLLRGFALILLCFWILPIIWGSWGIWLAVPMSELLTFLFVLVIYWLENRRN